MLSKVLHGESADALELFVFPSAGSFEPQKRAETSNNVSSTTASPAGQAPDRSSEIAELQNQVAVLRDNLSRIERDAFDRGYQQGQTQSQAEVQPMLQRMNSAILETISLRSDLRRASEKDLVQLALAIAKRVLHREMQVDSSALSALARFAFERMGRAEKYTIRAHPDFANAIEQSLPRRSDASVIVEADPECAPGTLQIRTENGAIDASVESQLEEISRGLADKLG